MQVYNNAGGQPVVKLTIQETSDLLVYSFRYAIGRLTGAPSTVCRHLRTFWPHFKGWEQRKIQQEIREAQARDGLGSPTADAPLWLALLDLPTHPEEQ